MNDVFFFGGVVQALFIYHTHGNKQYMVAGHQERMAIAIL